MMQRRVRYGLIGAGGIAQAHLQAFSGSDHSELCGVADPRSEPAAALAESAGCPSYESYRALADAQRPDAVVIATPPSTHLEIALFFLERGVHVLCEKPLSTASVSAVKMLEAARSANLHLTMGSKFRYSDDVVQARSLIASGILGQVIRLENTFTSKVDMTTRWNSRRDISGGGVLIDNGTHSADIMRFFTGPVSRVFTSEARKLQAMAVEDTVHVDCTSLNGVLGTFDLSWSVNSFVPDYIRVWGSNGTLCVGWQESRYRLAGSTDWVAFGKGYNKVQGLRSQLENFSRTVKGQSALRINSEDVLASVHVIEACYRSLQQGQWVDVDGRPERRLSPRDDVRMELPPA